MRIFYLPLIVFAFQYAHSQELAGHFAFTVSSNKLFNGATGYGIDYFQKINKVQVGVTYDYSGIYKTIIETEYNNETEKYTYENRFSTMECFDLAFFCCFNLKNNDNARISYGPLAGVNLIRKWGSYQLFSDKDKLTDYEYAVYDNIYFQSEAGFFFESEVKNVIFKNMSFCTKIKTLVSGIENVRDINSRDPLFCLNGRIEVGLKYTFSCNNRQL